MKGLFMLLTVILLSLCVVAQRGAFIDSVQLNERFMEEVSKQQSKLTEKLRKQQKKVLNKLYRQEQRILKKVGKVDSVKAKLMKIDIDAKYNQLQEKLKQPLTNKITSSPYIPRIDSLETMLKWLEPISHKKKDLDKALSSVNSLKGKLSQTQDVQGFISEREYALKSLLSTEGLMDKLLIKSLSKSISQYNKEVYYYKEKIAGFKETLNDPAKIEQEALRIAQKIPAFQKFMQQNSQLAQLFGAGGAAEGNASGSLLPGLQTRTSVTQQIQQQLGIGEINPQQYVQQQLGAAQAELTKMKNKLERLRSGGNDDGDMRDFTPNNQKAKPFLKRLEYGFNLQTGTKAAYDFPSTNDIALTLGYKLHDRLVAGVGMSYKFGLGKGWKDISFTHEGIGWRSYIDWKLSVPQKGLKVLFGNLWLSGGYEQSYMSRFRDVAALRNVAWQTSGLLGISKKIQYKKKELKVSLLWDFLSQQNPIGNSIIFRYGYNF